MLFDLILLKFRPNPILSKFEARSNLYDNMFLRLFEVNCPEVVCKSLNHPEPNPGHRYVNQYYQCYLKPSSQFICTNSNQNNPLNTPEIPYNDIQKFVNEERANGFEGVLIYTDGGFNEADGTANGGILAIDENNMIYTAGFNLDKLRIKNGTRAEVATIVEAINLFKGRLVKIFTDSENAITQSMSLNEGLINWNKIGNADLWFQIEDKEQLVALVKVKGHSDDRINSYVDYLADLNHVYEEINLKLIGKDKKRVRDVKDVTHYRLHDIVNYSKKGILDEKKFTNQIYKL